MLKPFMRYRGNKIFPDEWTNKGMDATDGQPEKIMPSSTLSAGEGIR